MSKNKAKFEVSISKSVTVQLWGDLPYCIITLLWHSGKNSRTGKAFADCAAPQLIVRHMCSGQIYIVQPEPLIVHCAMCNVQWAVCTGRALHKVTLMPPARAPLFNSHHQHFHLFLSSKTIATSSFTPSSRTAETKTAPKHILPTALKFLVCQNNNKKITTPKNSHNSIKGTNRNNNGNNNNNKDLFSQSFRLLCSSWTLHSQHHHVHSF